MSDISKVSVDGTLYQVKDTKAQGDIAQAQSAINELDGEVSAVQSDMIVVSDTEPQTDVNKLWIVNENVPEYTVPTYEEHSELRDAFLYNELASPLTGWNNNKYRRTDGDAIGAEGTNANYRYLSVPCQEGDAFVLNVAASGVTRVPTFVFTATDGTILQNGDASVNCSNYYIEAPENAACLYINDKNSGGVCYKNTSFKKFCEDVKASIATAKNVNVFPLFGLNGLRRKFRNVTFLRVDNRTIHVSGTTTNTAANARIMTINAANRSFFGPENKLKFNLSMSSSIYIYLDYTLEGGESYSERINNSGTVQLLNEFSELAIRLIVTKNSTVDEDVAIEMIAHPDGEDTQETVKVLCIGNSFTSNAVSYAPALMKSIGNVRAVMAKTYSSGARITQYNDWFDNDSAVLSYHKYNPGTETWSNGQANKTLKEIIADEDWDIITFSPGRNSGHSDIDEITSADVNELIYKVLNYYASVHTGKGVKVGWLMPQISPGTASSYTYQECIEFVQEIYDGTPIDFVIPGITSIENARTTSLNDLGDYGGLAHDSTGHIQAGIGALICGYTTAVSILKLMGKSWHGILQNPIKPDEDWIRSQNAFGHGEIQGVTDKNCYIAQKCVIAAMKNPYEITTITEDEIPSE